MMTVIFVIALAVLIEAVVLAGALLIASYVAELELPFLSEFAWKVVVVVIASNVAGAVLNSFIGSFWGSLAGLAGFWMMLSAFFKIDLFKGLLILLLMWGIRLWLISALKAAFSVAL